MRKTFAIIIAVLLSMVSANAQYTMKVTLKNGEETEFNVFEIENVTWQEKKVETHEYVDLGLPSGTKWATCNIGASAPEEYGDYYAWGETETKDYYDQDSYSFYESGSGEYKNIGLDIRGTEYDVAHVKWGDKWRMPSDVQMEELTRCCTFSWETMNGVNGCKVTGPNGNSIFLPAAGYRSMDYVSNEDFDGSYITSSLYPRSGESSCLSFNKNCCPATFYSNSWPRTYTFYGHSVRPVYVESETLDEYVDLDLPSGTKWATCNMGASTPEEFGNYYAWGETAPKETYTYETYSYYDAGLGKEHLGDIGANISGTEYDAARATLGDEWRMPTQYDFEELRDNCEWENTIRYGVVGYFLTSKSNGKSIFFPAAGMKNAEGDNNINYSVDYWTASLNSRYDSIQAITFDGVNSGVIERVSGLPIRPVMAEKETEEYVDLGLSVKWATHNVGATAPEEYGEYYAWGETEPKDVYSWDTYFDINFDSNRNLGFFEYQWQTDYQKIILDPEDDVAHVKWGGSWRMPTIEELHELCDNCTWTSTLRNGIPGQKVTGPNGNSIFLPYPGYRYDEYPASGIDEFGKYWANSLYGSSEHLANVVGIGPNGHWSFYYDDGHRFFGCSVRPVCE